jgi:hypothetical protein
MATKKSLSKKGYKKGGRKTNGRKTRGRKLRKTYKKNMKGGDCSKISQSDYPIEGITFVFVDSNGNPVQTENEAAKIKNSTCPAHRMVVGETAEKLEKLLSEDATTGKNQSRGMYEKNSNQYPRKCCVP